MDNPNFEPSAVVVTVEPETVPEETLRSNVPEIPSAPENGNADNASHQITTKFEAPINVTSPSSVPEPLAAIGKEPVSDLIKCILHDPATFKLLIVIVSALSILSVSPDVRHSCQAVPSFVINGFSLIYSIFVIFITVIYKSEESVENCGIFQKLFAGRYVNWHEFHSTMTLTLAMANFSCIAFEVYNPLLNVVLAVINTVAFGYEFVRSNQKMKLFVTEKSFPKCNCKITKRFFGLFQRHPIIFNVLQVALFITAFILYQNQAYYARSYFIYCSVVTIIASVIPVLLRLHKYYGYEIGTRFFANPKNHTYFSIGITIHAGLAVLSNAVDYQPNEFSFTVSCIIFVLSFFDLYSQAIFYKARSINNATTTYQSPFIVKTEQQQRKQPFRNLPTIIENPLGIEGVKEVYEY